MEETRDKIFQEQRDNLEVLLRNGQRLRLEESKGKGSYKENNFGYQKRD